MIVLYEQGKITDAATKSSVIYYWKNNLNGKGYVGQTLNSGSRVRDYTLGRFKKQRAFYAAVQKYGIENFTCYKVMDCCPSKAALNYWEAFWVKELDTLSPNGYNLTSGGEQPLHLSDETRLKISESNRGKIVDKEIRKKISDAARKANTGNKYCLGRKRPKCECDAIRKRMIGNVHSEETRKKIGDANRGRKHTEEAREKMRLSYINGRKPLPQFSQLHKDRISKVRCLKYGTLWKKFFVFS